MCKEVEENNCLSFLDTVTTRVNERIQVSVYRKPTYTDKYLDFICHHPVQHKRSVANTLRDRAKNIHLTRAGKCRERSIKSCDSYRNTPHRVSGAPPKESLECCGAIILKLVSNLSTLCAHASHGPRTNLPLYNPDV